MDQQFQESNTGREWDASAGYDRQAVLFYDVAHEGAHIRSVASIVENGDLDELRGFSPRSLVIVAADQLSRAVAQFFASFLAPMELPIVVTHALPHYVGPLDIVVFSTAKGAHVPTEQGLATAAQRGCTSFLVAPPRGPVVDEVPAHIKVIPQPPTTTEFSPSRLISVLTAIVDSLKEDPRLVADRLVVVGDDLDKELTRFAPDRDALVNPARELREWVDGGRIIHTGRSDCGQALAELVSSLWTAKGLVSGFADWEELLVIFPDLQRDTGATQDIFFDPLIDEGPALLPLKVVVWAEEEPGLPNALAQNCEEPAPLLSTAVKLITRAWAATTYDSTSKPEDI